MAKPKPQPRVKLIEKGYRSPADAALALRKLAGRIEQQAQPGQMVRVKVQIDHAEATSDSGSKSL